MSIQDAEVNRQKQESKIAARRNREAEARPDAVHRALIFILKEVAQNNPDSKVEADFYVSELDQQMNADVDVDETASQTQGNVENAGPDAPQPIPQSKRFRRASR